MIRSHKGFRRKNEGFTLVEVIIALLVFSIVITSGFACVKMGLTLVDNSRHHTRAAQIMQSEIERVRSMPWASLTALPRAETAVSVDPQFNNAIYGSYAMKRAIAGVGATRKISLVVSWKDISGKSHTKSYVTLYTKGGLYDYIQ
jgi:prepilin-type N-terminal cleavage/methylation domain-containing protein